MIAKETSLEFVERMERTSNADRQTGPNTLRYDDIDHLIALAKTAALIDTNAISVQRNGGNCVATVWKNFIHTKSLPADLHTAVRAVADKIKEGK